MRGIPIELRAFPPARAPTLPHRDSLFIPFSRLLPRTLQRIGMGSFFQEEALKAAWPNVVSRLRLKNTARNCRVVSYKRGEVEVVADSSVVAAELQLAQQQILQALRKRFPGTPLTRLRIVHRPRKSISGSH